MEFIFLGTGTSSCVPNLDCLTRPPNHEKPPCRTCLSTLTPEGKKNIRRNTSGVVRTKSKDGQEVTIVIDAGKTFQPAVIEWFPKHGLRRIDALLITHAHADAMNGLDDLRGWTLGASIQPHIDVYVSAATFKEVKRAFPYLVSKEFASGGGDVAEFVWHIIEDKIPFEINDTGVFVTPFSVHHGRLFTNASAYVSTPGSNEGSSEGSTISKMSSEQPLRQALNQLSVNGSESRETVIQPYLCFGFKIQDQIIYLSDVSYIPDDAWSIIHDTKERGPLLCILDCLNLHTHTSHFGMKQSIIAARQIGADRTYLVGFSHTVSHDEYVTITEAVGGTETKESSLTEHEKKGLEQIETGERIWMRPAHDGLRVILDQGLVRDDTYDKLP